MERGYHHGNLREALVAEAVRAIAADGPTALSLRELARRAGVSHAAPHHHFKDKTGLLTAVAAEGFRRLADDLRQVYRDTGSFLEVGVAYVHFAIEQRPYFEVMFRPDLYRREDPELAAASERARAMLYGPVEGLTNGEDVSRGAIAAWALVHGLATLILNDNLPPEMASDPEATARSVASLLFARGEGR
jgi:AcrR family transcriptional regulator